MLFIAIFPSFLSQIFFMRGVELIGPARAGIFINLVPIFGAILAVLILSEPFHLYHALALGLVFTGIWLSERRKAPEAASASGEVKHIKTALKTAWQRILTTFCHIARQDRHMHTPVVIAAFASLLVVIALLQPLARRLDLAPSVLIAAVGAMIGVLAAYLLYTPRTDAFNALAYVFVDPPIDSRRCSTFSCRFCCFRRH
ncbi:DMT family transporter [Pannonibacter sp. Pt2-lr]